MAESPSVWGRMFARFQGEVPAETLEAYRRASLPVFERMDQVEARRLACATEGLTPWTIPPATRTEFLCAWNAFVLQTLGNDIVEADYTEYPATAGYVPPVTADQVMAYFSEVEGWLDRANQAQANPEYRLDVDVPARLPPWSEVEPCPESHLRGLISAMKAVGEHAAAAMAVLPESAPDAPEHQKQLHRIRQLHASAQGKARYAAELHGADPPPAVQERVEPYAREAIEMFYELGQLIADPALAGGGTKGVPASAPGAAPLLPSQPEFDKWLLTEPDARDALKKDGRARAAINRIWRTDPNPLLTCSIHREIETAMERGDVGYAMTRGGQRVGHWFRCPWGPIYVAKRIIDLDGVRLLAGQQFVFEVRAAEPGAPKGKRGNGFIRRILLGTFKATESVVYDEPGRGA
jgi:hypothetical protein